MRQPKKNEKEIAILHALSQSAEFSFYQNTECSNSIPFIGIKTIILHFIIIKLIGLV